MGHLYNVPSMPSRPPVTIWIISTMCRACRVVIQSPYGSSPQWAEHAESSSSHHMGHLYNVPSMPSLPPVTIWIISTMGRTCRVVLQSPNGSSPQCAEHAESSIQSPYGSSPQCSEHAESSIQSPYGSSPQWAEHAESSSSHHMDHLNNMPGMPRRPQFELWIESTMC
ncbi:hypothetical protein ACJMK2_000959 [Sinanodonta woodiana]|uniref:Uncharacterized protein n=1 Tax=Sinanodonta woodiana TaxID=1069815 RepID=A0ABD3XQT7_SINWO